jgi:phosphatidylinositol 4-kinase
MIEQLASLLLPIDALLGHDDFNPRTDSSPDIVSLFRNIWFLCVLFGFTSTNTSEATAMDWLRPALSRIATKTPSMVVEETHDAAASDVEYNSVIRQEYANTVTNAYVTFPSGFLFTIIAGHRYSPELFDETYRISCRRHSIPVIGPSYLHFNSS